MTQAFKNAIKAVKPDEHQRSIVPSSYDMSCEDFGDLLKLVIADEGYKAIELAFFYGFVMGNRCTIRRKFKRL